MSGYIPRFSFGGVPSAPNVSYDNRLLTGGTDFTFNFNDNVTITKGTHNIKLGGDVYRIREYEGEQSTFSGTFDFGKNTLNPLDTNYAFSNAALGVFNSYTESNVRYGANMRQSLVEWFAQDSWKVSRRLNIDYGVRWTWAGEMYPQQSRPAVRVHAEPLQPEPGSSALHSGYAGRGQVCAESPDGRAASRRLCGPLRPGRRQSGAGRSHLRRQECAGRLRESARRSLGAAPGICTGCVWQRQDGHPRRRRDSLQPASQQMGQHGEQPAGGLHADYVLRGHAHLPADRGVLSPSNTQGFNLNNKTPDNYNITLGVQQDIGRSILVDVSYVGTLGQHIPQTLDINTVPYGTHFLPQYTGGVTDNFFRPFPGYNNVSWTDNAYNSNYHALLLSINRRFANGLQFGFSYTFSKFMDYTGIPIYRPLRTWSYGFDGSDQTHNAVLNLTYNLPKASRMVNDNKIVKWVFDDWTLIRDRAVGQRHAGVDRLQHRAGHRPHRRRRRPAREHRGQPERERVHVLRVVQPGGVRRAGQGRPRQRGQEQRAESGRQQHGPRALEALSGEERETLLHASLGSVQRVQPHAVLGHQYHAALRSDDRRADQRAFRAGHLDPRAAHDAGFAALHVLGRAGAPPDPGGFPLGLKGGVFRLIPGVLPLPFPSLKNAPPPFASQGGPRDKRGARRTIASSNLVTRVLSVSAILLFSP